MPVLPISEGPFLLKDSAPLLGSRFSYELYNAGGARLATASESHTPFVHKLLRWTDWENSSPFKLILRGPEEQPLGLLHRKGLGKKRKLQLFQPDGNPIGFIQPKRFRKEGQIKISDAQGTPFMQVNGSLNRKKYTLIREGENLATIHKKWGGIVNESLSHKDLWHIELTRELGDSEGLWVLAIALAVDRTLR